MVVGQLRTERLVLRRWRPEDRQPFAELNADPTVMEHFPSTLDRLASDALAVAADEAFERRGFGLWAVELVATGAFLGFTGLAVPQFTTHFTPAVEIGWRISRSAWGHGYATEAASAALADGFERVQLEEIVSFTARSNVRSQAVMQRLGMARDPDDDFDHPRLAEGHPLRPHVLYRIDAPTWRARRMGAIRPEHAQPT
ncbi:MAG: GNAT family N-acetyltransferase [Actinomycetota bacterium]|nr:GNAT family N-acetyltransferase [Actinomycetota bacterium]